LTVPSLRGAKATKQSTLALPRYGLLRGACHRAALRADPLARNDVEIVTAASRQQKSAGENDFFTDVE
jgi:hypothetical protein